MSDFRISPRWLVAILLLIIFGIALYLRIAPAHEGVFVSDVVKFNSNDSYYFLRQIDNLVHNYPHLFSFDPYLRYPTGMQTGSQNLFVYLLGSVAWIIGLGSPNSRLIEMICAYYPPVIGALTIIPVYFIGKALFNRKVGIIAAALIAVLPGELLGRTILGSTDRDALQLLLTTLMMLFLILAVKSARETQLTFQSLVRNLLVTTRPIIYCLLTGIILGLCLLMWKGSFLFVLIIIAYFIVQSFIDQKRYASFEYLSVVGILTFLLAFLIFVPATRIPLYSIVLAISLVLLAVFSLISWLLRRGRKRTFYYPLAVIVIGLLSFGIFYAASPTLLKSMLSQFSVFIPTQTGANVSEMGSILMTSGRFTLDSVWLNYTTGLYLSLISLGVLIYLSFKRSESNYVLLIVWGVITLAAVMTLRRFAPFFAINVSLLTSYLAIALYYAVRHVIYRATGKSHAYTFSKLPSVIGFKSPKIEQPSESTARINYYEVLGLSKNASHKQIKKAYRRLALKYQSSDTLTNGDRDNIRQLEKAYAWLSDYHKRAAYDRSEHNGAQHRKDKTIPTRRGNSWIVQQMNIVIAGLIIFFIVFFPNFKPISLAVNQSVSFAPSDAWYKSLVWLKDNTPDPFEDPNFYYALYETPFRYPNSSYGVMAWWDYGYWITRIGQRPTNCDPGGGYRKMVARFLTAQNESSANKITGQLDSKYIVIDYDTIIGNINAIATYAGNNEKFWDIYHQPQGDRLVPVLLFHPEYYRSLGVRLYNFEGKEFIPQKCVVISYKEKISREGSLYREITDTKSFSSYEEARVFVSSQGSGNYKIVSDDPVNSPIPLEPLEHYKLIHSVESTTFTGFRVFSSLSNSVKIFEYIQ